MTDRSLVILATSVQENAVEADLAELEAEGGAGVLYLYGLSPVVTFYRPDDKTRGEKNAERVSRAAHKITEIIEGMGVLGPLARTVDLDLPTARAEASAVSFIPMKDSSIENEDSSLEKR